MLVVPGEMVWIDVIVPVGHRLWCADVGRSMEAIGAAWVRALAPLSSKELRAHEGAMVRTPWSDLVCFDGVGPGEVLAGDAKLVGISQRRTRTTARFQCALHLRHDPEALVGLLAGPLPGVPRRAVATLPGITAAVAAARLAAALDQEDCSG